MGCFCAKPALPVPPQLVGTWISNEHALSLRTGYGKYRYKRGNIMGVNPSGQQCTRLHIGETGEIAYAKVGDRNHITLIDMPVTEWAPGQMVLTCSAPPLQYRLAREGEGGDATLVVDGQSLQRHTVSRPAQQQTNAL